MKRLVLGCILAGLLAELRPAHAHHGRERTRWVTPRGRAEFRFGWRPASLRSGGSALITVGMAPGRGELGSLELSLPPGDDSRFAEVELWSRDVELRPEEGLQANRRGFGRLVDLKEASYMWLRQSESTSADFLAPAFRLIVFDPDEGIHGSSWDLVYEPVYNGYPPSVGVPEDTWVRSDVAEGVVWRIPIYLDGSKAPSDYCPRNPQECYRYDRKPREWGYGPRAVVIGMSVAAGSGWFGTFRGNVDQVRLGFKGRRTRHWNFEPCR